MGVRDPNNVGGTVQTDPTLLHCASAITEQKKCWELLAQKFDRFQLVANGHNNSQQCWVLLDNKVASVSTWLKG